MADLPHRARKVFEEHYELAESADRHKDPRILQLLKAAAISGNQRALESVRQRLTIDAANRLIEGKKFSNPVMAELLAHADPVDSLVLGRVLDTDLAVLYSVKLTRQHLLVIGATGEGKTNFLFVLVIQFVRFGSVWIFEGGMKTDFRHLTPVIDDLLVFVAGGAKVFHAKRPDVRVAAAQKCATDHSSLFFSRGGRCSAWNCIEMSGWRLSMRA